MSYPEHTIQRTETVLPTLVGRSLWLLRYPYSIVSILILALFEQISFADQLFTKNGQSFEGDLIGMEGGYISLQESKAGATGLAVRRFTLEDTLRIEFSDADRYTEAFDMYSNKHFSKAIPLLESLAFRRLPFLGKLEEKDEHVFSTLLLCYSATGLFEKCLHRHKLWNRKFEHPSAIEASSLAVMTSSWEAGFKDEAELFAGRWIEEGRSSRNSAVAWLILAERELEKEDFDQALWISLQPIAFADRLSPDQLNVCYEIAITSATAIGEAFLASTLAKDMMDRGFSTGQVISSFPESKRSIRLSDSPKPHKLLGNP